MTDQLVLDLVEHGLVTDQIVLTVGYDIEKSDRPGAGKKISRGSDYGSLRKKDSKACAWDGKFAKSYIFCHYGSRKNTGII